MEELKEDKQIRTEKRGGAGNHGQVPPWIQRWGITVMAFLMVLFLGMLGSLSFHSRLNAQCDI